MVEVTKKEYAFALKNGSYRFLVIRDDQTIRVFIEGDDSRECCLALSIQEYLKMANNFIELTSLL